MQDHTHKKYFFKHYTNSKLTEYTYNKISGRGQTQAGGGNPRAPLPLYETLYIMQSFFLS